MSNTGAFPTPLPDARVRVVLAEADPTRRRAVRDHLQASPSIVVVAGAGSGVEAVELSRYYRPAVLLLATRPPIDAPAVIRAVAAQAPEVRLVLLGREHDEAAEVQALLAGASGVLSEDVEPDALVRAVRSAAQGEAVVSRHAAMRMIELLRAAPIGRGMRPTRSTLTSREWEVLDMLAAGRPVQELADELFVTPATVKSHLKSIRRKLGVKTRDEMIAAATRLQSVASAA